MEQVQARIASNTPVLPGQNVIWFEAPGLAPQIQPGQFVMIRCGDAVDPFLRRPMSVHRVATGPDLPGSLSAPGFGLLIGVGGGATQWLAQQPVGSGIDVLGPLGRGFVVEPDARHLLMVGGGYGVAPLIGFAERARRLGREVILLVGAQTAAQAYPAELLPDGVRMEVVTNDGSSGRGGLVTDHVPEFAGWADQMFACGPVPMYRSLRDSARIAGFAGSIQVLMEEKMACGVGTCGSCEITTHLGSRLVCLDGPMFEADDLLL